LLEPKPEPETAASEKVEKLSGAGKLRKKLRENRQMEPSSEVNVETSSLVVTRSKSSRQKRSPEEGQAEPG